MFLRFCSTYLIVLNFPFFKNIGKIGKLTNLICNYEVSLSILELLFLCFHIFVLNFRKNSKKFFLIFRVQNIKYKSVLFSEPLTRFNTRDLVSNFRIINRKHFSRRRNVLPSSYNNTSQTKIYGFDL